MSNIKQIKVGETTYNIEPYTSYLPLTGGMIEGDLVLHAETGNSPKITLQRGDGTGTLTDWNLYVESGLLKVNTISTSNSTAETLVATFGYDGSLDVPTLKQNGKALSTLYAAKANGIPNTQTADAATFLRNDNTWQKVTPANIGAATATHSHGSISGTVTKDIGGISKNTVYDDADIYDVLNDLLFPYVAPSDFSITTTASSGTFEYGISKTITKVTPSFTKGSKNITSIKIGTTSGGSDLYSGTSATNGSAITLTTSKTFDGTTGGTIYCTITDGTTPLTTSASVSYTYYSYSKLTTSTTPSTSGATKQSSSNADNTYSYSSGQYLWLYSRSSGKKIQQYISGTWADVNTSGGSSVTLTLASGKTATYYAYRTDKFTAAGSARYRLA